MFKIEQQDNKLYTLRCYSYSQSTNKNIEIWSASNLDEAGISNLLKGRSDKDLEDSKFAFVVVKSGNGPVILTEGGELKPVVVKSKKRVYN